MVKEQEGNNYEGLQNIGAGGAILGGAALANKNMNKATGMETLYHGSSKENIENIKREGLQASRAGDGVSTRRANLRGKLGDEAVDGKVYMAGKKSHAQDYANQAALEAAGHSPSDINFMTQWNHDKYRKEALKNKGLGDIATIKIPYDDLKGMDLVDNPELKGLSKEEWINSMRESGAYKLDSDKKVGKIYDNLKNDSTVIQGDVPSKYIKGSDDFIGRQTLRGLADYAKENPKRFTQGAGAVAGGLGLAGAGAYNLYDRYLNDKEAFVQMREEMEKIAQEYKSPETEIGGILGLGAGTLGTAAYLNNTRLNRELDKAVADQKRLGLMSDLEEKSYRKAYRLPIIRESLNPVKSVPQGIKTNLPLMLGGAIVGSGVGQIGGALAEIARREE